MFPIKMRAATLAAVALISLASTPVHAQTSASLSQDQELERAYRYAFRARVSGHPKIAVDLLERVVAYRPNNPRYVFEYGVAQASVGSCDAARKTLSSALQLQPTPDMRRATDAALSDLCPSLHRTESGISVGFVYDTNYNGGADSNQVSINGIPFTLSEDAMAQTVVGYSINGSLGYNIPLRNQTYLNPRISAGFLDLNGSKYDKLTVSPSLFLRVHRKGADIRFGPTAILEAGSHGIETFSKGFAVQVATSKGPISGNTFSASILSRDDKQNDGLDGELYAASWSHSRLIAKRKWRVLDYGLSYSKADYHDDLQDLSGVTASVGLRGNLTKGMGYRLSGSYTHNWSDSFNPVFNDKRRDDVFTLTADVSFHKLTTAIGTPYAGVSWTKSSSSFSTKTYTRARMNFGLTMNF